MPPRGCCPQAEGSAPPRHRFQQVHASTLIGLRPPPTASSPASSPVSSSASSPFPSPFRVSHSSRSTQITSCWRTRLSSQDPPSRGPRPETSRPEGQALVGQEHHHPPVFDPLVLPNKPKGFPPRRRGKRRSGCIGTSRSTTGHAALPPECSEGQSNPSGLCACFLGTTGCQPAESLPATIRLADGQRT